MGVKYITVTPITNLFVPATRSFGDIAIIGAIDATAQGLKKSPLPITNPLAVSSQPVTLTTSGATAAGNSTLQFAAVPPTIQPGMIIADLNSPTNQPSVTSSHSQPITLVTNATTAAANGTLHFAGVPNTIQPGMAIIDLSNSGVIPAGTTVSSITSNTVVMSQNASGAGVGASDVIQFFGGTTVLSKTSTTVVMSQNAIGTGVNSGDAIQFTNPFNGNPVDDVGWFKGQLGASIKTAFAQSPGPTKIWAIATDPADGANAVSNALTAAAKISVRIVVLANTPLISATKGKTD